MCVNGRGEGKGQCCLIHNEELSCTQFQMFLCSPLNNVAPMSIYKCPRARTLPHTRARAHTHTTGTHISQAHLRCARGRGFCVPLARQCCVTLPLCLIFVPFGAICYPQRCLLGGGGLIFVTLSILQLLTRSSELGFQLSQLLLCGVPVRQGGRGKKDFPLRSICRGVATLDEIRCEEAKA